MSTQLSEFSADTVISATQGQLSSELDGESIILHLDSGIYYGLSKVGARIWALVQQPCSFSNLQRTLLEEYQVSEADCIQAVVNILRDLKRAGLIEVRDEKV